jgi:hypothetical protein
VNRAGSYSFTFGFAFDPGATYPLWDDSIAASYPLSAGGEAASAGTGGLAGPITGMQGAVTHPADPAWIASLTPLQLPTQLDADQWHAAGFPSVSGSGLVAAQYTVALRTQIAIDDPSGETANLTQYDVTLTVQPDPQANGGAPAAPQTVFITKLAETSASVNTDAQLIQQADSQLQLAKRTAPLVLSGFAVLSAACTTGVVIRHRRRSRRG